MINTIIVEGRLTEDPSLRYTSQGVPVAQFQIASNRPFANAAGQRDADFFHVVAWRKLGEVVGNNLSKGRLISVQGRMQMRSYEAQDGSKRVLYEIQAHQVNFLDRNPHKAAQGTEAPVTEDDPAVPDDLPF